MNPEAEREWRQVYGGRQVLFVQGLAVGDIYRAAGDVFRVRLWSDYRLQGGWERLVISEERAREVLLAMLERRREEGAA